MALDLSSSKFTTTPLFVHPNMIRDIIITVICFIVKFIIILLITLYLKKDWDKLVDETLIKAKLKRPEDGYMMTGSKKGIHTEMLGKILSEMQYLPRAYPDAKW